MFQHCALIRQLFPFFWELDLAHEKSKIGFDLAYIHFWNYNPARVGEKISGENFKIMVSFANCLIGHGLLKKSVSWYIVIHPKNFIHYTSKEFIPEICNVKFNDHN